MLSTVELTTGRIRFTMYWYCECYILIHLLSSIEFTNLEYIVTYITHYVSLMVINAWQINPQKSLSLYMAIWRFQISFKFFWLICPVVGSILFKLKREIWTQIILLNTSGIISEQILHVLREIGKWFSNLVNISNEK